MFISRLRAKMVYRFVDDNYDVEIDKISREII